MTILVWNFEKYVLSKFREMC